MAEQAFNPSQDAQAFRDKVLPGTVNEFAETDPEYAEIIENFAFDQAVHSSEIDNHRRFLCILAGLMGVDGTALFEDMVVAALNAKIKPVEIKEVVYQATPYLGMGRVLPFLKIVNKVFEVMGVALPLESGKTVTEETRLEAGNDVQIQAFGETMRECWTRGPEERQLSNKWLANNCFGDYYTRTGLTLQDRELVTFCYIVSLGGAHPQAIAHAVGNVKVGNSRKVLYDAVYQLVPYIGYPRALNAMAAIDNATAAMQHDDNMERGMNRF